MSVQRNIQKTRYISSAPADTTRRKHVHFREIHSEESTRRHECQSASLQPSIRHPQLALDDSDESFSHTLSHSSATTSNTPNSGAGGIRSSQSFYRLPDDLLARGDFIAYQGANVTDFFNTTNTTRPKRVSEICLVNDHYILVKIPASQMEHVATMDTIAEEEDRSSDNCAQRKGFLRYFPGQRNRRVLPLTTVSRVKMEEAANTNAGKTHSTLKCPLAHCWRTNETPEVFDTRTKIFGLFWKQKAPGKVITIQPTKSDTAEPLDLRYQGARNAENGLPVLENDNKVDKGAFGSPLNTPLKVAPTPSFFGGALQTSLHDAVSLEQHAAWINDDDLDMKQVFRKDNTKSPVESKATKRRTNVFRWFFKRTKAPKPKNKIHAVVYKTYFVRWKKPPDEKCPHCGHARNDDVAAVKTCKWKRCRSATF
ncbi:uncharacterized protein LOC126753850 [Bactrocera neohumeralis]|uniref:uncharacterized protein LOC126753850 n=1 Tax=Bactrocera neohumeralis TaxID=98809 RepID=UPI0021652829|nr:uncharacterized protein LOC126753850 [Bactrocera neohumeralis]